MATKSSSKPVALVIGGSRGMGRSICIDLAKAGYAVVVSSKTESAPSSAPADFPPDPNSFASTIHTVAREITDLQGGTATALAVDTRSAESVTTAVHRTVELYGRLDVLVYNAGAVWWAPVSESPFKRFRLLQQVNVEGFYAALQAVIPIFSGQRRGRVVAVCPPIYQRFFRGKTAYSVGKVGMSVLVKGLGMDWDDAAKNNSPGGGLAITGLWPGAAIETAVTKDLPAERKAELRTVEIFSQAVLAILRAPANAVNGLLTTDEDFLKSSAGGSLSDSDLEQYALVPGQKPRRIMPNTFPDLKVEGDEKLGLGAGAAAGRTRARL